MSNILTSKYRAEQAAKFKQSLLTKPCFVTVGQHTVDGTDSIAATATDTDLETQQVYSNLIAGVQVAEDDVVVMIDRNTWSTGKVFDQYSRASKTRCFVTVEQGSTKYVYKCLNNAQGSTSVEVPSGTNTVPFETSDGYVWQYMFTVAEETFNRFATDAFVPFVEDATTTEQAIGGTIDSVTVVDPGVDYTNVIGGTFRSEDITTGSTTTYKLASGASNSDDFYNGCVIEVVTPSSPAFGQMRTIIDYNGTSKLATIDTAFSSTPEIGDVYEVSPGVVFASNGVPTTVAKARALIANGGVASVVIAERGAGYRDTTATVVSEPSVGATAAIVEPNVSPGKGHGYDIPTEAFARSVCIEQGINLASIQMEPTNDVRSVSLMSDPLFSNVVAQLDSGNPERFGVGEQIVQLQLKGELSGNTTFTSPATLTANTSSLQAGDQVLITSGSQTLLVDVEQVANTTSAVVSGNFAGTFEGTGRVAKTVASAQVASTVGSDLNLEQVSANLSTANPVYGKTSRSLDNISSLAVDGRASLASFNQTARLEGSFASGSFVEDEQIVGADGSTAHVFSINQTEDLVSVTDVTGGLGAQQYTGQTSGAVFTATAVTKGDTAIDSGEILFVNNITPISITSNKKITAKINIEF